MPQMFTPSFFRRDVQPPPEPNPAMSPVSIAERTSSSDNSDNCSVHRPEILSQIQIPDTQESDEKRDKARKAAKYLKLILHCQVSIPPWPVIQIRHQPPVISLLLFFNFSSHFFCFFYKQRCNGKCKTLVCKNTRLLLNHCAPCLNREKCHIKGCFQTKKLLCHMIACRFERKQAKKAGIEPKYCNICSAVDSSTDDDGPQDNTSPTNEKSPSIDVDGAFARPTVLPRRFRSSTQGNLGDLSGAPGGGFGSLGGTGYNCRSFSVEEESEEMEMEEEGMADSFTSRRVSI